MNTKMLALILALAGIQPASAGFSKVVEFTVNYTGSSLSNFPVLVRLSPTRIDGFSYNDLQSDGKDICFVCADGVTVCPHEIDTWNPQGESLVWVNVPVVGPGTKFLMQYGDRQIVEAPPATDVWEHGADGTYGGVWHFNDAVSAAGSEVVADSAKRLDGLNMNLTPTAGSEGNLREMQSCTGAIGLGRVNGSCQGSKKGNGFSGVNYDALAFGDQFTVSLWFHTDSEIEAGVAPGMLFARKEAYYTPGGYILSIAANGTFSARRGFTATFTGPVAPDFSNAWVHVAYASRGDDIVVYTNGAVAVRNSNTTANTHCADNGNKFCIGLCKDYRPNFCGSFDEARLLSSGTSDDWIAAEYATVAQSDFVTAGAAVSLLDRLLVSGDPVEIGTPTPDYGWIAGVSGTITGSAPVGEVVVSESLRMRFAGWKRYVQDVTGWRFVAESSENSYSYSHTAGDVDRIVWQVVRRHPVTIQLSNPSASGSFLLNGTPVSAGTVWMDESDAVTIRAVPGANVSFERWASGPVASLDAVETTFPLAGPVTIVATFSQSADPSHTPTTCILRADATSYMDAGSWSGGAVPSFGDTVYLTNSTATTVALGTGFALPRLAKLVVGGKTTLVLSNWFTKVSADEIEVRSGGTITCEGPYSNEAMSNRVWLAGGSLTVAAGGSIHVNKLGYAAGCGPAWEGVTSTDNAVVAHGGDGSVHMAYGSAEWPFEPGSGNQNWAHAGGGSIFIDLTGDLVVDGSITATADNGNQGYPYRGGSGGSVCLVCRTVSGSGVVSANSQDLSGERYNVNPIYASCGGRVAVHYAASAQSNVACNVRFEARGGISADVVESVAVSKKYLNREPNEAPVASCGTIWFTDNQFLDGISYRQQGWKFVGQWTGAVPLTAVDISGDLAMTNCWLTFPSTVSRATFGDNLEIAGTGTFPGRSSGLIFPASVDVRVDGNLSIHSSRIELGAGGSLTVARDLALFADVVPETRFTKSGGAHLVVYPASVEGIGARVDVGGTWSQSNATWVLPWCDPQTGAYVAMTAKALRLDAGACICADSQGFGPGRGPGIPAQTTQLVGASHGGHGAADSATTSNLLCEVYGSFKRPCEAGSGGSLDSGNGFPGGGVVHLTVARQAIVNGTISANAATNRYTQTASGGSGGTVFLSARNLMGETPVFSATGGAAMGPVGGGGRIAIYASVFGFGPETAVTDVRCGDYTTSSNSKYSQSAGAGEEGTVWWGVRHGPGVQIFVR